MGPNMFTLKSEIYRFSHVMYVCTEGPISFGPCCLRLLCGIPRLDFARLRLDVRQMFVLMTLTLTY